MARVDPAASTLIAVHVAVPVMTGTLIYLSLRSTSLLVFHWGTTFGLQPVIDFLRRISGPMRESPEWFRFTLPDALWVYAFTAMLGIIWRHSDSSLRWAWLILAPTMSVGSELGQLLGHVPGTFDVLDLAACVIASYLALHFSQRIGPQ